MQDSPSRRRFVAAVGAAAAVGLAGCGQDGGGAENTPTDAGGGVGGETETDALGGETETEEGLMGNETETETEEGLIGNETETETMGNETMGNETQTETPIQPEGRDGNETSEDDGGR